MVIKNGYSKKCKEQLNQFQQLQQQAQTITMQKNNNDIQIHEAQAALDELNKTDETADRKSVV